MGELVCHPWGRNPSWRAIASPSCHPGCRIFRVRVFGPFVRTFWSVARATDDPSLVFGNAWIYRLVILLGSFFLTKA